MKKMINTEHIEGRIYTQEIVSKTVQNPTSANYGKEFLSGNLNIAVDEDGMNVITVHFTYVTPTTNAGKVNMTYTALSHIMKENKTWVEVGKDDAMMVKIDTALALNDWYDQNNNLVSLKTNEGGFVTIVEKLCDESARNTFTMDMFITNTTKHEISEENNISETYLSLNGAVFNFRNALLPVEFVIKNPYGMKYFEAADISNSNPMFTKVWGRINSTTQILETSEESAFGEPAIKTVERKTKEWVVTGTSKVTYDYPDENYLTENDIVKASQDRQVMLAERKQQVINYRANLNNVPASEIPKEIPHGNFNF